MWEIVIAGRLIINYNVTAMECICIEYLKISTDIFYIFVGLVTKLRNTILIFKRDLLDCPEDGSKRKKNKRTEFATKGNAS